ncbi:hypothetical protein WJX79_002948 [Trebouxia sp. C0005]
MVALPHGDNRSSGSELSCERQSRDQAAVLHLSSSCKISVSPYIGSSKTALTSEICSSALCSSKKRSVATLRKAFFI